MNRQQRRHEQPADDPVDGMGDDAGAELAAVAVGARTTSRSGGLPAGPPPAPRRATPRVFLHEVNVEMRKVVWPTRAETVNYASVVLVTLAVLMALIFGLDLGFSKVSLFLFK